MKKIVIDTLGSDKGEEEIVRGVILSKRKVDNDFMYILFGNEENIRSVFLKENEPLDGYEIHDSPLIDENVIHDVMSMFRFKEHCSMVDALEYAKKDEEALGVVSTGSTGMLLVSSILHMGMLKGVSFPALATFLYNIKGNLFCLLDCGANIEIREDKLFQFAQLGVALMRSYRGIENPRVGLLNVGKEENKGDSLRRAAYPLFQNSGFNFVGNIEGNDVFLDKVDVVACDGFSGNMILKNAESVAMICKSIAMRNGDEKTAKQIYDSFGYTELGGAVIVGTKKPIVKAHGASNSKTVISVIDDIIRLSENNFIVNMEKELERHSIN
jgi:phosphate acyltransferase